MCHVAFFDDVSKKIDSIPPDIERRAIAKIFTCLIMSLAYFSAWQAAVASEAGT